MNLMCVDMIISLYGIPIDINAALSYGWKMGKGMCYASGFILTLSGKHILVN